MTTELDTTVPEHLLAQAHAGSLPDQPVVFVRFYPQLARWITFRAVPPRSVQPDQAGVAASAKVNDPRTGKSFSTTPAAAPLLQQIFDRRGQGVAFREPELPMLGQGATVIRVMHLVHTKTTIKTGTAQRDQHAQGRPAPEVPVPPQVLSYHTVPTPPGQTYWTTGWQLSRPSRKGGWIVQHIVADTPKGMKPHTHLDYWEAWRVYPGASLTNRLEANGYDDMFDATAGVHATGSARLYEGLRLPHSFVTNNPKTAAHILRSTTHDPKLSTQKATAPVDRQWTAP